MIRDRAVSRIVGPGMVKLEFALPWDLAQLRVRDRLVVAAFLVGHLAVGRLDGERAARAPQDVDQGELFERQVVDPEGPFSFAPETGVEVDLALVQAVEDDFNPLPVLGWLEPPFVEGERSTALARASASRWNDPVGADRGLDPARKAIGGMGTERRRAGPGDVR